MLGMAEVGVAPSFPRIDTVGELEAVAAGVLEACTGIVAFLTGGLCFHLCLLYLMPGMVEEAR